VAYDIFQPLTACSAFPYHPDTRETLFRCKKHKSLTDWPFATRKANWIGAAVPVSLATKTIKKTKEILRLNTPPH
jgi:hypothetical protein